MMTRDEAQRVIDLEGDAPTASVTVAACRAVVALHDEVRTMGRMVAQSSHDQRDHDEIDQLRAEVASLRAKWDRQADRWAVMTPDGTEWFDDRTAAETYAIEWMTDALHDHGEACDEQCTVLAVVSTTREIVGAEKGDGSDDGEWLRERGLDYMVEGYTCEPGGTYLAGDAPHPAAVEAQQEVERLRAQVADVGWAGDWFTLDGPRVRWLRVQGGTEDQTWHLIDEGAIAPQASLWRDGFGRWEGRKPHGGSYQRPTAAAACEALYPGLTPPAECEP